MMQSEWIAAFSSTLREVRPDLTLKYTTTTGATLWPQQFSVAPQEAARAWAAEHLRAPVVSSADAALLLRAVWATLKTELAKREEPVAPCLQRIVDDMDTGFDLLGEILQNEPSSGKR